MYLIKHRSGFVHDGLSDNGGGGTGSPWAAIATIVATAGPLIFGGGGKQDAKARDRKRHALSQIGFNWLQTSGVPAGQEWNIDNWPDVSLDNIAAAYNQYGQIVATLHNQKVFHPGNTQSMAQIEQIVQQHGGGGNNPLMNLLNQNSNQAGFDYNLLTYGMIAIAGVAVLASVLKQGSGTKKRK